MPYVTDGSVGYEAIKNEKKLAQEIESWNQQTQISVFQKVIERVDHKGGTQNISDVDVISSDEVISISDKTKKNILKGSYDYINSSTDVKYLFPKTYDIFLQGKDSSDNRYKQLIVDSIISELNSLPSESLTNFINDKIISHYLNIKVCITDVKTKKSYFFDGHQYEFIKLYQSGYKFKVKESNKQSKKIVLTNGDLEVDLGLRIRLALNNGKSLWIRSLNGRTSTLTIKIQQDSVSKIIPKSSICVDRTII
jgi:hypothetical protein